MKVFHESGCLIYLVVPWSWLLEVQDEVIVDTWRDQQNNCIDVLVGYCVVPAKTWHNQDDIHAEMNEKGHESSGFIRFDFYLCFSVRIWLLYPSENAIFTLLYWNGELVERWVGNEYGCYILCGKVVRAKEVDFNATSFEKEWIASGQPQLVWHKSFAKGTVCLQLLGLSCSVMNQMGRELPSREVLKSIEGVLWLEKCLVKQGKLSFYAGTELLFCCFVIYCLVILVKRTWDGYECGLYNFHPWS